MVIKNSLWILLFLPESKIPKVEYRFIACFSVITTSRVRTHKIDDLAKRSYALAGYQYLKIASEMPVPHNLGKSFSTP